MRARRVAIALAALAVAPATAPAARTVSCVLPLGPNGQPLQVTLRSPHGRCPSPGEAIPTGRILRATYLPPAASPTPAMSSGVSPFSFPKIPGWVGPTALALTFAGGFATRPGRRRAWTA